jgi:ubiquinone/menaquinone biosynthesis C-methylase UbiE
MDNVARYNQERWKALAEANALFSRFRPDLNAETARNSICWVEFFGDLEGRDVLCLAGGGGQQSAAFALLGANVTVVDLSDEQLERDRLAAGHYGLTVNTVQGDMRDLSALAPRSFDIVYQPYSINFVPDCREVFRQTAGVLRREGYYHVVFANPFTMSTRQSDWNGAGYVLTGPYDAGATITYEDQDWVYDRGTGPAIQQPVEYRHNLATVINELIGAGFSIRQLSDNLDMHPDTQAKPGSWEHYTAYAPPWLSILSRLDN